MNAAFVVTISVPDTSPDYLAETAFEVEQAMLDAGFEVISVNPWNRSGEGSAAPLTITPPTSLATIANAIPTILPQ